MGLQQLKIELANLGVFQELTDVLKATASAKFPKMKRNLDGFRNFAESVENNISNAFQFIDQKNVTLENFKKEIEESEHLKQNIDIEPGLKKFGLDAFYASQSGFSTLLIVLGSNQGFCGKSNREVSTQAMNFCAERFKSEIKIVCVGKKTHDQINAKNATILDKYVFPDKDPKNKDKDELVRTIFNKYILNSYLDEKLFQEVFVLYNSFSDGSKTGSKTEVKTVCKCLLPIKPTVRTVTDFIDRRPIFEPSPLILLSFLIKEYLFSLLLQFFYESETAENFLRMNAMNMASDAVKEAREKQESVIRKTRQTTITRELVEIISGAEALKRR